MFRPLAFFIALALANPAHAADCARLERQQKGLEGTTPQLTGKYAAPT